MPNMLFSEMDLSQEVKKAVEALGFEEPTSIQAQSIPLIMQGKDVIGHSQTGTGKTAAFSIPAIEKIDHKCKGVQVLILCPTRELAIQACDEIKKFTKFKHGIKAVPIFGGQQITRQITALKQGAQIVVGTPGRVMDHMRRKTLKLENINMVILDEADEMLSMGFREDIETILKDVSGEHQTVLFSATLSPEIMQITKQYQTDPEIIKITRKEITVPNIDQLYYEVPSGKKIEVLSRLLDTHQPLRSVVFCNTKRMVDELAEELQVRGYSASGLHGDIKQITRTQIMNAFKKGNTDILVATDVAARGIDVEGIEAVFNYDIPQDMEYYVHRIGRTGRAGKSGKSFTFVTGRREIRELINIQNFIKAKIKLMPVPTYHDILETKSNKLISEIEQVMEQGNLQEYNQIVDTLLEQHSTLDITAALIKMLMVNDNAEFNHKEEDDVIFAAGLPNYDRGRRDNRRGRTARTNDRGADRGADRSADRGRSKLRGRKHDDRNMVRLKLNIGKDQKVSVGHILSAVASSSGLPGKNFGRIEIFPKHTHVDVPKQDVNTVLESMSSCKIMGRKTTIKKA